MSRKKTPKRKRREKAREIDHIPKCWKQPRSAGGPKRRTDFSLFFCSSNSSSPLSKGILLDSSSKDKPTSDTISDLEETRDKRKEILELPAVECSNFEDLRQVSFSDFIEVPVIEVEPVSQNAVFEALSGRNADKQNSDIIQKLEFTSDKSQTTESSDVCITPGSVLQVKAAGQLWWPAECVEDRTCNPAQEFQDDIRQALHPSESQSLGNELIESSDEPNCSIHRDQSPDKWNSSSSSRTGSDYLQRRRGTRERKPKVHFDDVTFPLKSVKKGRRFRIMRFLGLAAPIGSPFH